MNKDEWWIDWIEKEFSSEMDADLQALLEVSADDRKSYEGYRLLRDWLRGCDTVLDHTWRPEKLTQMKDSIMSQIEAWEALSSQKSP